MTNPHFNKLSRRRLFQYGIAGLAMAGGAGAYRALTGGLRAGYQSGKVEEDARYEGIREKLGKYIFLTPQKLGGGTHAVDLNTNKTMSWISYWNYGDSCPISHHLAAFHADSGDPYKGFEFVNSTQGGDNILMYGLNTRIKQNGMLGQYGQGNHIYRVGYDGKTGQMELLEDVAESTGLGLGVHTNPFVDGTGFCCSDGQKDVTGFFSRARGNEKTKALAAFRADWIPNAPHMGDTWMKGGKIILHRLAPALSLDGYDLQGSKGNKINYEMAPMNELLVERGQIPGDNPRALTGLDFCLHDPRNRFSLMGMRMCGGGMVFDRHNMEPVCFIQANEGLQDNYPVKKISGNPDTWEVVLPAVGNPIHETGFNPSGNHLCMMNNLRANNVAVFDTTNLDPRKWKRVTFIKDQEWQGEYPSPFHLNYSIDGSKCFFTVLRPKPMKSDLVVVDTATWKVLKKFRNVGVDTQTLATTYDGKYGFVIFSGFQRLETGSFVFRQDTLEQVGYLPNFGGHHDCVIVPSTVDQLKFSRSCTV
ncbi:MAG: hypothetical protein NTV55_11430 [Planctomycetota bacterium]|nr:hypothetical protein [Planctomycetota bacterium]